MEKKSQSTLIELACNLALCELVVQHNKLPQELMNDDEDESGYKDEYQDEFNRYYDEFYTQLSSLNRNEK